MDDHSNASPPSRMAAISRPLSSPGLTPVPAPLPTVDTTLGRSALTRRLSYIMLVRVILFTMLLGGTVGVYFAWGTPEELASPYVTLLFVLIVAVFLLSILYAVLLGRTQRLRTLAAAQIGVDLLLSAVLVHFTGSAESPFVLFFFLSPIAAAVTLDRRAALITATVGTVVLAAVMLLGFTGVLPLIHGQKVPWEIAPAIIGRSLLINTGAMFALAALSDYLAEQLRSAATHVEAQQAHIDDLSVVHADVIRCLTSGLVTLDTVGAILTINQAAADMLGADEEASIGRPLHQIAPELAVLAATQVPLRRAEIALQRDDKRRVLGLSVSPLTNRDDQSIGRILNFQDLTALKEMERTVKRSEHLAALGRVAAGVAHEIRNPMASISGSLELLSRDSDFSGDNSRLMGIALREIERLDGLIGDLLVYARPKPPKREPIDIGSEISSLVTNISALLSSPSAPQVDVAQTSEDLWVCADRDQLSGVLWNLIRNASQAGERETVEVDVLAQGSDQVLIQVRDRGKGIEAEHLEHIFEPFYTTRDKGSGLGLAIVHRTILDHGGTIDLHSRPGEGATVRIHLPRVTPPLTRVPSGQRWPAVKVPEKD